MQYFYSCILVLLFLQFPVFSNEEDLSTAEIFLSAESEPLTTVSGCVNVASGQFFQVDTDLNDNTIDPLSLVRFYDSGTYYESFLGMSFGSQYPLLATV